MLQEHGKGVNLGDCVAFSDADFAGCSVTFKSHSGSILYYKGCPVLWSSRRQSIRARSTCEAEYVGLYDTIQMVEGQSFLSWFNLNSNFPLVFSDNQSSITVANSTLATKRTKHFLLRFHHVK